MTQGCTWIESALAPPAEDPGAWVISPYRCASRELLLAQPRNPDQLLDDPKVLEASRSTDYMPYWAYLWPGAILLAEEVICHQWHAGVAVLEIGCGLGLAGLAALAQGAHVTFSDYSPAAIALAAHNAHLNHFERFSTRLIDWQCPPGDHYAFVLGGDVLYEKRCVADVLRVLDAMLAPGGEAWLSDPGRSVADEFPDRARAQSFSVIEVARKGGRIFKVQKP